MSEDPHPTFTRIVSENEQRASGAPWPVWVLAVLIGAAFLGQFVIPDPWAFGVSAGALREGRWYTLVTCMFIHAGAIHLFMNGSAMLGLGAVVSRRMGASLKGALAFWAFFLAAGVAGSVLYVALHPTGTIPAVGASGAIFGLWGAMARLQPGETALAPLRSRRVWMETRSVVISNLVIIGLFFGLGMLSDGQPMMLAWEAHAGGYLFGLLVLAPFLRLAGESRAAASPYP